MAPCESHTPSPEQVDYKRQRLYQLLSALTQKLPLHPSGIISIFALQLSKATLSYTFCGIKSDFFYDCMFLVTVKSVFEYIGIVNSVTLILILAFEL